MVCSVFGVSTTCPSTLSTLVPLRPTPETLSKASVAAPGASHVKGIGGVARTGADSPAYLRQPAFILPFYVVTGLAMTTPPPGTNVTYSSEFTTPGGTSAGRILR